MKQLSAEPTRLLDMRPTDAPADVVRLVRSAARTPADPVPRLKTRIRCSLRQKSARRRRYLRATLLGLAFLLAGGGMAAVLQPMVHRWQQRKDASLASIEPAAPAARARQRRATPPLLPGADPDQPAVAEPAPLGSQAPTLVPAPSLPAPAERSANPPDPSLERLSPRRTRGEPPGARPSAALAPRPLVPPAAADAPTGPSVSPALARAASDQAPARTTLLDPGPAPTERWTAMAPGPSAPSDSSSTSASPPVPPGAARPSTAAGSITPAVALAVPAAAPSPLPDEQALLSEAVRHLRSEHRPESALADLDVYLARFPDGSLLPEASRLRTEALLALGHKSAALVELNREGGAGREESRLVRGELRAAAGRWQDALEDFDAVVRAHAATVGPTSSAKQRERLERALWGRASARSHLGDEAGARADLRECLRRFPQGRFAVQAARLLGERP